VTDALGGAEAAVAVVVCVSAFYLRWARADHADRATRWLATAAATVLAFGGLWLALRVGGRLLSSIYDF
jgi:hypothetical protein